MHIKAITQLFLQGCISLYSTNLTPPIKNVDTTNSDGDEGGTVFVYVLVAGVLFVGFMWYEGGL